MLLLCFLLRFLSQTSSNLQLCGSSAVRVVSKLMLLFGAPRKNEFNMKVGRASLHSIVMPHLQWGADTGNVIGKMSGQTDRFSVNCYIIRSVINPSETTACRPPDRRRNEEVYTPNADTVHIMLKWFRPSWEIYYTATEDALVLTVNLLLLNVCGVPAENQLPIRQKPKTKSQQHNEVFCRRTLGHTGGWLCGVLRFPCCCCCCFVLL